MKLQKLLILLIIAASLIPAYYLNAWLQNLVQPRKSLGQLMLYIVLCFALVFGYTFLLVAVITRIFPAKG